MNGRLLTYNGCYKPVRTPVGNRRVLAEKCINSWPELAIRPGWVVLGPKTKAYPHHRELVVAEATSESLFCAPLHQPGLIGRPILEISIYEALIVADRQGMPWRLLGELIETDLWRHSSALSRFARVSRLSSVVKNIPAEAAARVPGVGGTSPIEEAVLRLVADTVQSMSQSNTVDNR